MIEFKKKIENAEKQVLIAAVTYEVSETSSDKRILLSRCRRLRILKELEKEFKSAN